MKETKSGHILIIDDEEVIRTLSEKVLTKFGFSVDTASDGHEGIHKYTTAYQGEQSFDAVVLDLTLSEGPSGLATLERLKAVDASVRAIVCSGYSSDPIVVDWPKYGFAGAILKPFRAEELVRVVKAVVPPPR